MLKAFSNQMPEFWCTDTYKSQTDLYVTIPALYHIKIIAGCSKLMTEELKIRADENASSCLVYCTRESKRSAFRKT